MTSLPLLVSAFFLSSLTAASSDIHSPPPASTEHSDHWNYASSSRLTRSTINPADLLLVSTIDGTIHAMNINTGVKLWSSMHTSGPLVSSLASKASPLSYIVEPMDNAPLLVHTPGKTMTKLPVSVKQLVRDSPFRAPDGTVYLGHKTTHFLTLDARTGRVLHNYGGPPSPVSNSPENVCPIVYNLAQDPLTTHATPIPIFLGRTEYHVSMYAPGHHHVAQPPSWNVSYAQYDTVRWDWLMGDDLNAKNHDSAASIVVAFGHNGDLVVSAPDGDVLWAYRFSYPPLSVFDLDPAVNLDHSSMPKEAGFHLLRRAPVTFPPSILSGKQSPPTAYIGHLGDTLYALSSRTHFPVLLGKNGAVFPSPFQPRSDISTNILLLDNSELSRSHPPLLESSYDTNFEFKIPHLQTCQVGKHEFPQCLVGVHPVDQDPLRDDTVNTGPSRSNQGMPKLISLPLIDGKNQRGTFVPQNSLAVVPKDMFRKQEPRHQKKPGSPIGAIVIINNAAKDHSFVRPSGPRSSSKSNTNLSAVMPFAINVQPQETSQPGFGAGVVLTLIAGLLVFVLQRKYAFVLQPSSTAIRRLAKIAIPVTIAEPVLDRSPVFSPAVVQQKPFAHGPENFARSVAQLGLFQSSNTHSLGSSPPPTPNGSTSEPNSIPATSKIDDSSTKIPDIGSEDMPIPMSASLSFTPPLKLADGTTQVGRLILTNQTLGYGSRGTVVYQGSYEGRDVAIKRLLRDFYDVAQHEIRLLVESDNHSNVIRYFCNEQCDRFLYIALELCDTSLADFIESATLSKSLNALRRRWHPTGIMFQILSGLHHLHSLNIVHRDLKPHNILIICNKLSPWNPKDARVQISDFGLCKKLEVDQSSFRNSITQNCGTLGWRAPELLGSDQMRITRALDIFSLGCIFYYIQTGGGHPFGDQYSREFNILQGKCIMDGLNRSLAADDPELVKDMIRAMISPNPESRPPTAQLLVHPTFWSATCRVNFLADVSDRLEFERKVGSSRVIAAMELNAGAVVGMNWCARMDRSLMNDLGKFRKYHRDSVVDLLRALRNKKHHYHDLAPNVKRTLGSLPDGFLYYFTARFPRLFLHVYQVVVGSVHLYSDPLLATYFVPLDPSTGADVEH